jgi:predicted phosphodiesterase
MPKLRIAVMSDIHGNLAGLDAVLADLERRTADIVVNLGTSYRDLSIRLGPRTD